MRILLVEDNPGDSRLLQEYLKDAGADRYQVTHADRLAGGLERLAEANVDAVLLDLSLPDSQGMDTLVRMREAAKAVPIVVLTGIEDEALGMRLIQAGAQDYLIKGQVSGPLLTRSLQYAVERKRAEEELQRTLGQVRTLSRRLEVVREEERTRIARELHDELGVRMACLKMGLARMQSMMGNAPLATLEEKILSMTEQVDTTIAAVQDLVAELRPGVLDDLGLVAAIEWQCRDFERRSGIRCVLDFEQEDIPLDSVRATAAFRICQEALTNVLRHAAAKEIRVSLELIDGQLLLDVQDDGQGIAQEKVDDVRSFGLLGMRERADAVGGALWIAGLPGLGTTVSLRLSCE
jgi:signal transduction histidine kinase